MEQIYNPYLPLTEYIPDGEPHIFGDRVYIYGSHDKPDGKAFCEDHYTVWSAPVHNLRDWRKEGISYLRNQDPSNADDKLQLWAPDVVQGIDGRYYLYYCLSFQQEFGVAVSDSPSGPFRFYGHVRYPKHIHGGKLLTEYMPFDPAVLVDDGRVFLYYGSAPAGEKEIILPDFSAMDPADIPEQFRDAFQSGPPVFGENSMVVELESDMLTVKEEPRILIPGEHHTSGTGFKDHGFFEASSIRKIYGKYYFIYSSHKSHELCYAISDFPDKDFIYGGTIISNGDIGLNGRTEPVAPLGNNHGSILQAGDDFYIFYHRPTNGTEFSRQGCAEKIEIQKDGSISQVPITSCGLNGGALHAEGSYPAAIACHLTDPTTLRRINYDDPVMAQQVQITQKQNQIFITNIKDRTTIGYKYFSFTGNGRLAVEIRGDFSGTLTISHTETCETPIGSLELQMHSKDWKIETVPFSASRSECPLYLHFRGEGTLDFKTLFFLDD